MLCYTTYTQQPFGDFLKLPKCPLPPPRGPSDLSPKENSAVIQSTHSVLSQVSLAPEFSPQAQLSEKKVEFHGLHLGQS